MVRTSIVIALDWCRSLGWVVLVKRIIWITSTLKGISTAPSTAKWRTYLLLCTAVFKKEGSIVREQLQGSCYPEKGICCEVSTRGRCEMVKIPGGLAGRID